MTKVKISSPGIDVEIDADGTAEELSALALRVFNDAGGPAVPDLQYRGHVRRGLGFRCRDRRHDPRRDGTDLTMNPDWVGVAVHYPDGKVYLLQIDHPRGSLDIENEAEDVTMGLDGYRSFQHAGRSFARVEFSGPVGTMERRHGPRPDWPSAPAGEITEGPREIEGI